MSSTLHCQREAHLNCRSLFLFTQLSSRPVASFSSTIYVVLYQYHRTFYITQARYFSLLIHYRDTNQNRSRFCTMSRSVRQYDTKGLSSPVCTRYKTPSALSRNVAASSKTACTYLTKRSQSLHHHIPTTCRSYKTSSNGHTIACAANEVMVK